MANKQKLLKITAALVLTLTIAAGFFIFKKKTPQDITTGAVTDISKTSETNFSNLPDTFTAKIYFPINGTNTHGI